MPPVIDPADGGQDNDAGQNVPPPEVRQTQQAPDQK